MDFLDDPRRKFLIKALQAGAFTVGLSSSAVKAGFFGQTPKKLPAGKSLYRIEGQVKVNGKVADANTIITANDTIETMENSQAVFAVGQDAFLLRKNSKLKLTGRDKFKNRLKKNKKTSSSDQPKIQDNMVVESLRLVTGGALTVFGKTAHEVKTVNASIGIRGTGVYFESEENRSYVCTCYGETVITADNDPDSKEALSTKHHDAPRYILSDAKKGEKIIPAPYKNHADLELMLLEELVGRTPPFAVSSDSYNAPRRGY